MILHWNSGKEEREKQRETRLGCDKRRGGSRRALILTARQNRGDRMNELYAGRAARVRSRSRVRAPTINADAVVPHLLLSLDISSFYLSHSALSMGRGSGRRAASLTCKGPDGRTSRCTPHRRNHPTR